MVLGLILLLIFLLILVLVLVINWVDGNTSTDFWKVAVVTKAQFRKRLVQLEIKTKYKKIIAD